MDNILIVQKLECQQGLINNLYSFYLRKSLLLQHVENIAAHEQFLDHEEICAVLKDVEHPNNVRVL